jgi:hypothetical protein
MRNLFVSADVAANLIRAGQKLLIAGAEPALERLPHGTWIGGTTPYFMGPEGGVVAHDRVFCTVLDEAVDARVVALSPDDLPKVTGGRFGNGFTFILLPAFSAAHSRYALEGPKYRGLYTQPVIGWVTGVDLAEVGKSLPKVFDGSVGIAHDNAGLLMYVSLPDQMRAEVDIVNLFTQGSGDVIEFDVGGFSAYTCRVNGEAMMLADHLRHKAVDIRLPLVADYAGAMINVSFQSVQDGLVKFYAPVVAGVSYRVAAPVADYGGSYRKAAASVGAEGQFSCNCILNFLYAGLQGNRTANFVGPVTFGEIAYILLNQTLVRLAVL